MRNVAVFSLLWRRYRTSVRHRSTNEEDWMDKWIYGIRPLAEPWHEPVNVTRWLLDTNSISPCWQNSCHRICAWMEYQPSHYVSVRTTEDQVAQSSLASSSLLPFSRSLQSFVVDHIYDAVLFFNINDTDMTSSTLRDDNMNSWLISPHINIADFNWRLCYTTCALLRQ